MKEAVRELLCQECSKEYQVWFVESSLWNLLTQHDGGKIQFLCPTCFTNLLQKVLRKKDTVWKLYIPNE